MRLQERDYKILRIAYEHGFIHQMHVQRLFPNYTEMRRRIREMKKAGFILEEPSIATDQPIVRLTSYGWECAAGRSVHYFPKKPQANPFGYLHELKVISVRMRLEELWKGHWIPERAFRGRRRDVPDGIFRFASGKEIYIEVENSLKSRHNFKAKMNRYDGTKAILILYVACTKNIYNGLKKYLSERESTPATYGLMTYENLMSDAPEVWYKWEKISAFHRSEF